jgi:NAD dependent epimerase/dehydratase family enzyme
MGEELLLASDRMRTTRLEASGYAWRHPELEPAMERVLNGG